MIPATLGSASSAFSKMAESTAPSASRLWGGIGGGGCCSFVLLAALLACPFTGFAIPDARGSRTLVPAVFWSLWSGSLLALTCVSASPRRRRRSRAHARAPLRGSTFAPCSPSARASRRMHRRQLASRAIAGPPARHGASPTGSPRRDGEGRGGSRADPAYRASIPPAARSRRRVRVPAPGPVRSSRSPRRGRPGPSRGRLDQHARREPVRSEHAIDAMPGQALHGLTEQPLADCPLIGLGLDGQP